MRQHNDIEFQNILQELRWGNCSESTLEILKSLKDTTFPSDIIPTKLYSTNVNVDKINNIEFEKLLKSGAKKNIYKNKYSKHTDTKKWSESIKQPKYVELCIGAQVLVTYNIDQSIINGTRGYIISMSTNSINIRLVNNDIVTIPYVKLVSTENDKIYIQFMPLKLAYALSIHRCQGSTLDAIEIDIGKSIFEYGQAYVSLSRAKSLSSVKILDVDIRSFKIHPLVKEFYNQ